MNSAGGNHSFELKEMDVSPLKLAARLQRAGARVVLWHSHPHAESPPRRLPANGVGVERRATDPGGKDVGSGPSKGGGSKGRALLEGEEESLPLRPDRAGADETTRDDGAVGAGDAGNVQHEASGKGVGDRSNDVLRVSETETVMAGESDEFTLRPPPRRFSSGAEGQDASNVGRSPSLPGPSPAGWASPAWTFEGRIPSTGTGPSRPSSEQGAGKNGANWRQRRMWSSGHLDSEPGLSPGNSIIASQKDIVSGVREKRRTLMRRSSHDSVGSGSCLSGFNSGPLSAGSTSAPTATGGSISAKGGPKQGNGYRTQQNETESDSDDQLAVRASAFASSGAGAYAGDTGGRPEKHGFFAGGEQVTRPSSPRSGRLVVEMENAFASERRRWEE